MQLSIGSRQGCMRSAKNIVSFPKQRVERRQDELAFLPAALEIVETPPSPIGRAIIFTIIAVFSVALAWACIDTVDIVAVAPGKIIPSGRTKTIQPFETGVVRAIRRGGSSPILATGAGGLKSAYHSGILRDASATSSSYQLPVTDRNPRKIAVSTPWSSSRSSQATEPSASA